MHTRALNWSALLLALAALPAVAVAAEPSKGITTVAGAKLGASLAEVRKVFPKMEPTTENLGSQAFDSEFLARYVVRDVRIPETGKPGTIELRFWKDKLWAVIAYYGADNDAKVVEVLTKRLGPPNGPNPQKPIWQGDKTMTLVETDHQWYGVTDNALSKDAQSWFYAHLEQMKQELANSAAAQAAAQAAATAAATAAASTPAAAATPAVSTPAAAAPAATPAAK